MGGVLEQLAIGYYLDHVLILITNHYSLFNP